MKKFVLLVAGGRGSRMKGAGPKQFLELNKLPVLMHTFKAFEKYDPEMEFILVLPANLMNSWTDLCKQHNFNINHQLGKGGETRFHSVKNGLDLINEEGIVFIHDGVRPLVSLQTIQNCFEMAFEKGNALPIVSVTESLRYVEGENNNTVDRSKYFLVQTPQTFKTELIKKAYQTPFSNFFTDDASVLENMGETICPVLGNRENIKITYPEDLIVAQSFLSRQ